MKEWDRELNGLHEKNGDLDLQVQELTREKKLLEGELDKVRSQLSQNAPQESKILELPDAADLLNQLKAKRKKSKTDLQDVEIILEMVEATANE